MSIPVTTTFNFDDHKIVEYKGVVRGIVVRSPTIVQGILGGLKNIVGGKIGAYTEMCEQTRQGKRPIRNEQGSCHSSTVSLS